MPRAKLSKAAQTIDYFRTAPLDVATEILLLCVNAMRERQALRGVDTTKGQPKPPRRPKPEPPQPPAES